MNILNPATEEIIATLAVDSPASLMEKYRKLKRAQKDWARVLLKDRIELLTRFKGLLEAELAPLAEILTAETGKPLRQARNEINGAVNRIAWLTDHAAHYLSNELMQERDGVRELIAYEPLGVVGNISAWNYPYLVGVNVFVPALIAGNAVLYKPSEFATLTGRAIDGLLKRAGVPTDVFQLAVGDGEVGKVLLTMNLDGYFFTGSYSTGRYIYEEVSRKMVPCQLELGGKDPLYIADDVRDVKAVAEATADGAFYNNGQSCCSVERIYVHQGIYDDYLHYFVRQVKEWKMGNPLDSDTYFGPLTRGAHLHLLEEQVADALKKGAKLLCGGKAVDGKGFYFEPTVLIDVNHTMQVMKEESFGPIIGIMKVASDEEALSLMQDTHYGLTAGVYAESEERAVSLLKEIETGSAYWNCCDRVSAALPWSGRKHSGIGVTLSHQGLRAFTKAKAWHLAGNKADCP